MKRLFVVIALITTLIGSTGLCLAGELEITVKASDWLKAAKLPSHETEEGMSLLTEGEQANLLLALVYLKGYTQGIFIGGITGLLWGADSDKVIKYIYDCNFLSEKTGDSYDWVRDYLIANPSARNESTVIAFQEAFMKACGIKKE